MVAIDLNNIQGDIIGGLPKKVESFFFFSIIDSQAKEFSRQLSKLIPLIATADKIQEDRRAIISHKQTKSSKLLDLVNVNIAFSATALKKLGIKDNLGDAAFSGGMLSDARALGDRFKNKSPAWDPEFKKEIDGVILVTGQTIAAIEQQLHNVKSIFLGGTPSIQEIVTLSGKVRPGKEKGHEHFGFMDGISQPFVDGADNLSGKKPWPGQPRVRPGIILVGRDGDGQKETRPAWTIDGSFLAFRKLRQLVPEFDRFLKENALKLPEDPTVDGAALLGARFFGRWKSGAPTEQFPLEDNPKAGADLETNNNFEFNFSSQERCPFAAHIRKTNPRNDLTHEQNERHYMLRRGIPYGPEVHAAERDSNRSEKDRGLLFVAYQSSIDRGFHFVQQSWANNAEFPFDKPDDQAPGIDPIIGQVGNYISLKTMSGTNPNDPVKDLSLQDWVLSDGGEYFFSPTISALKQKFAS